MTTHRFQKVFRAGSFVSSRSSYVAQVSLYGYLKARAGTRYVSSESCLMDLTLHVLKTIQARKKQDFHISDTLARQLFSQTLVTIPEEVFESLKREKVILEFEKRLMRNDWSGIDDTKETFSGSRSALLEWAPVVEEFKIQDEEIVSNSIHFKWLSKLKRIRIFVTGSKKSRKVLKIPKLGGILQYMSQNG